MHDNEEYLVLSNGYLKSSIIVKHNPHSVKRYETAFNEALQGKKPSILDNSTFIRVSKDLAGQIVKVIRNYNYSEIIGILDSENKEIEFIEDTPLAFERWGEKYTPPITDFNSRIGIK